MYGGATLGESDGNVPAAATLSDLRDEIQRQPQQAALRALQAWRD